jgi:hypothetical protein
MKVVGETSVAFQKRDDQGRLRIGTARPGSLRIGAS